MFVYENQQERDVLKYGFQVYTETGGYLVLGRQKSYEMKFFVLMFSYLLRLGNKFLKSISHIGSLSFLYWFKL